MPSTYHETVPVYWNRPIGSDYFHLGIGAHPDYAKSIPGQFVMLRLGDRYNPLLRRPFSIHRLITQNGRVTGIELLYKVVGRGTRLLSAYTSDDSLDLLGPLGNGFRISPGMNTVYIAAGGIGVAPMLFLADTIAARGFNLSGVTLFLGGKSKADLLCRKAFDQMGIAVHATTDDGSEGDQCYVTHPLDTAVSHQVPDMIYACGPMDMLTCVAGMVGPSGIPCQISTETTMACGIGVCLGCAVAPRGDRDIYLHACREGPVFDADRIAM